MLFVVGCNVCSERHTKLKSWKAFVRKNLAFIIFVSQNGLTHIHTEGVGAMCVANCSLCYVVCSLCPPNLLLLWWQCSWLEGAFILLTDKGMPNEVSKLAMVCADEFQSCLLVSSWTVLVRNRTLKTMVGDSLMVCVYVCFLLFVYWWHCRTQKITTQNKLARHSFGRTCIIALMQNNLTHGQGARMTTTSRVIRPPLLPYSDMVLG